MRLIKVLIAAAGAGLLLSRLRRPRPDSRPRWEARPGPPGADPEPVLGYDGMDLQAVLPWLERANLDRATLQRIRAYEQRNQARQSVLELVDDLLA